MDDGRPCRNDANGQKANIEKERVDTKSGLETTTDTPHAEIVERHKKGAELNEGYKGSLFCGLRQEASSVSAANHLGIMGHFRGQRGAPTRPVYLPTGRFDLADAEIARRSQAGETFIL